MIAKRTCLVVGAVAASLSVHALADGWATFTNQTGSRLVAPSGLGSADPEEKDFAYADLDMDKHVIIDPAFYRPAEVEILLGDPAKATKKLGWKPETSLEDMIREMYDADFQRVSAGMR